MKKIILILVTVPSGKTVIERKEKRGGSENCTNPWKIEKIGDEKKNSKQQSKIFHPLFRCVTCRRFFASVEKVSTRLASTKR